MAAANVEAAPIKAKLSTTKSKPKTRLQRIAMSIPKNAPATILGANTPPSPPAPKVSEATNGFNKINKNKEIGITNAAPGFIRSSIIF
ncbi:hypothetical protein D3C87_1095320 [compost metagenome]